VIFYLLTSALGGIVGGSLSALGNTIGGAARSAASAVSGAVQGADTGGLEAQVRSLVNPSDEQQYRQTVEQAKQQAARAAEVARRSASRAGLFGFIALVLGAIAAWFGGGIGTPRKITLA